MGSLVEKDAVHFNALGAVGPSRVSFYVLEDITESPVAITSPHIAHSPRVGKLVEPLDSGEVIFVWQRRVSRTAVWIDYDRIVEVARCVQSAGYQLRLFHVWRLQYARIV